MKSNYKIAAAVIASFVLGVGAVNVLHAQAKLPAYVVAEIDVKDQDGYAKDFLPKAQANIKESGGKYLAGGFNKAISLSGSAPTKSRGALTICRYGRGQGILCQTEAD